MNRSDKESFLFGYGSIYNHVGGDANMFQDISEQNIFHTFFSLAKGGVKRNTQKRGITMYQFGSTTGPARYPLYENKNSKNGFSMLPRPVTKSRPGELGQIWLSHTPWLKELTHKVAIMTRNFYQKSNSMHAKIVLKMMNESINIVHPSLRICDTFFTQLVLVGSESRYSKMNVHIDPLDYVTSIVTFGDANLKGGYTVYYDGMSSKDHGNIQQAIPFQHGRVQIGSYDKIYHGVSSFIGHRFTFVYILKKQLLDHFIEYQDRLYIQYVKAGYPSNTFVSRL